MPSWGSNVLARHAVDRSGLATSPTTLALAILRDWTTSCAIPDLLGFDSSLVRMTRPAMPMVKSLYAPPRLGRMLQKAFAFPRVLTVRSCSVASLRRRFRRHAVQTVLGSRIGDCRRKGTGRHQHSQPHLCPERKPKLVEPGQRAGEQPGDRTGTF